MLQSTDKLGSLVTVMNEIILRQGLPTIKLCLHLMFLEQELKKQQKSSRRALRQNQRMFLVLFWGMKNIQMFWNLYLRSKAKDLRLAAQRERQAKIWFLTSQNSSGCLRLTLKQHLLQFSQETLDPAIGNPRKSKMDLEWMLLLYFRT